MMLLRARPMRSPWTFRGENDLKKNQNAKMVLVETQKNLIKILSSSGDYRIWKHSYLCTELRNWNAYFQFFRWPCEGGFLSLSPGEDSGWRQDGDGACGLASSSDTGTRSHAGPWGESVEGMSGEGSHKLQRQARGLLWHSWVFQGQGK